MMPPIGDGDAQESLTAIAGDRYGKYVGGAADNDQFRIATLLCFSQAQWFTTMSEETIAGLGDILGKGWCEDVLHAIGAIAQHPLLEVVSTQPMTQPIGSVAYMRPKFGGSAIDQLNWVTSADEDWPGIPEIRMDIKTETVQSKLSATTAWLPELGTLRTLYGETTPRATVRLVFNEVYWDTFRTVLGKAMDAGLKVNIEDEVEDLLKRGGLKYRHAQRDVLEETIDKQMHTMHKLSMRGPANRIVCAPYWARFCRQWSQQAKIVVDDCFPTTKILLLRKGASVLDGPLFYAPHCYTMSPDVLRNSPEEVAKDPTKPLILKRAAVRRRDEMFVAAPEQIITIETGPVN